ncbi:hypothetical protein [Methanococcoides vulcani]|uniref:hypothetical protein n=1 Tax=Methanococcoides vulcani TaxID=1353158 RepID=UPI000B888017|nr:hypothetical protein [Methanococcoides vulcani]
MDLDRFDKSALYVDAGVKAENNGDIQLAMKYYNKAIELNVNNYAAWDAKKELLFNLEEFEKAFHIKQQMSVIF